MHKPPIPGTLASTDLYWAQAMESNTERLNGRKAASLSKVQDDKLILVLGAPRSGTTWLAKIFDSHPQVVYRHEPDTVDRDLQGIFRSDQLDQHRKAAHDYLHRLLEVNTLKSSGSLPIFRKHHHNPLQHQLRAGMIYTLRALEKLGRPGQMATWIRVPDMINSESWDDLKVVVKSVSSLGRVRLFAEALPSARIVFIVRDPCGQIASMMRGVTLGKFGEPPVREILGTEQARQYGLTEKRLELAAGGGAVCVALGHPERKGDRGPDRLEHGEGRALPGSLYRPAECFQGSVRLLWPQLVRANTGVHRRKHVL